MRPPPPLGPSFFARWTSRVAVFSAVLLATAIFLHRLFSLPTPIAQNLAGVAFVGAGISMLMSILATIGIWRTGRPGTARVVFAILVSLGLMLWPIIFLPKYEGLPSINDVTTDTTNPPRFVEIAKKKQWLMTGGSDFHGAVKPAIPLGSSWVNEETFNLLLPKNP